MVRAPCCEKMGLKKGPWTPDEDQILISHIQRFGHGNWRALPKQAGLLRCGKSCRLRWINYLRPDIKRGNFTVEEEDTIISLHQLLGNRWSAIAARLPGRTDNEIKNVWHSHLKKRVKEGQVLQESKRKPRGDGRTTIELLKPATLEPNPSESFSDDVSSSCTESSTAARENTGVADRQHAVESSRELPEIEESFWSEALSMDNNAASPFGGCCSDSIGPSNDPFGSFRLPYRDDINFWLKIFTETQGTAELPEI